MDLSTPPNVKTAPIQEIFDYVVAFQVKQGRQSTTESCSGCMMRGAGGTMCAVGCLIPDKLARECDLGSVASRVDLMVWDWSDWIGYRKDRRDLADVLSGLQTAHDLSQYGDFTASFLRRAREVATTHHLRMSI